MEDSKTVLRQSAKWPYLSCLSALHWFFFFFFFFFLILGEFSFKWETIFIKTWITFRRYFRFSQNFTPKPTPRVHKNTHNFNIYIYIYIYIERERERDRYRHKKLSRGIKIKFWTSLFVFHIALMPKGKVCIQQFTLQLRR